MKECKQCGKKMNPVAVALSGTNLCGDCIDDKHKQTIGG